MIPGFLIRSLIAGIIAGLVASFIGVYVVLKKLSFFTHAISHGSLTGIAIAFLLKINPFTTALVFGSLIGLAMQYVSEKTKLYSDAIIGTLLPASISVGLIIISLMKGYKPDLMSYLFGDILSVTYADILLIFVISLASFVIIFCLFNEITLTSIDEEWAKVKGLKTRLFNYLFILILSLTIIIGAKIVGIILVSALVVMPSASSINIAKSLRQTFILSIVFGISSVILGISISYFLNLPSGPTIIIVLLVIFMITFFLRRKK